MYSITGHDGRSVNSNGGVDVLGAGVVALEGAGPGEVAPAPDGRTTRWDGHRSQRRLEMVRQIRRVVHEHGPDISMEEIATRLGTSKSILYRYFRDKTALQVALGEYILGRARSRLAEASASSRDPRRAVEAMVATYLEIVDQSRNVFLFVNRPAQAAAEGNLRVFVGQVEDLVAATLARLFPEGAIPAARLRIWAAATVGLVRGAAEEWITTPAPDRPTRELLGADLATMVWDGTHALISTNRSPADAQDETQDR